MKKIDIFDIKSTSPESKETLKVGEMTCSIVEWQAILGRLYAKAARFRRVTNKHQTIKKANDVRAKINIALKESRNECRETSE